MLNIDSIENGIVIDHITAGRGMRVYELLELQKLDTCVAIIRNARSSKFGKNAMAPFGPLTIANTIVTDGPVPTDYQAYFDGHGIQVIYPEY